MFGENVRLPFDSIHLGQCSSQTFVFISTKVNNSEMTLTKFSSENHIAIIKSLNISSLVHNWIYKGISCEKNFTIKLWLPEGLVATGIGSDLSSFRAVCRAVFSSRTISLQLGRRRGSRCQHRFRIFSKSAFTSWIQSGSSTGLPVWYFLFCSSLY